MSKPIFGMTQTLVVRQLEIDCVFVISVHYQAMLIFIVGREAMGRNNQQDLQACFRAYQCQTVLRYGIGMRGKVARNVRRNSHGLEKFTISPRGRCTVTTLHSIRRPSLKVLCALEVYCILSNEIILQCRSPKYFFCGCKKNKVGLLVVSVLNNKYTFCPLVISCLFVVCSMDTSFFSQHIGLTAFVEMRPHTNPPENFSF